MKKQGITSLIMMIALIAVVSCSQDEDNPISPERKKIAWACGFKDSTGYGMILYSADSGETWVRQGQGSDALKDADITDIWAVDENDIWAVGYQNTILRT